MLESVVAYFCSGSAVAQKVEQMTLYRRERGRCNHLKGFKHVVVLAGATSVIKSSGCQSHLIAERNSGHPDGSYSPEMRRDLMKQK